MGAWLESGRSAIAIIPARGNSKRVPRKNLRMLAGRPLVTHTIAAALDAKGVGEIVVSTDDPEIAAACKAYDVRIVDRPRELGLDSVRNNDVVRHVLGVSGRHDVLVLLQPTSPLRTGADIDNTLDTLERTNARSAMTVTPADVHPGKFVTVADGILSPYTNDFEMEAQSQQLSPVFRQNGAVYAIGTADFLQHDRFYLPPAAAEIMSPERSVDIDTELDFEIAEILMQKLS